MSLSYHTKRGTGRRRYAGQSFVELALVMPVMLLVLSGMVEVVFAFNDYLQMLDGARNGARDSADLNPYPANPAAYDDLVACTATKNFFRRTACSTWVFLRPVDIFVEGFGPTGVGTGCIDPATEPQNYTNDIVISIFTTAVVDYDNSGPQPAAFEVKRFDNLDWNSGTPRLVPDTTGGGDGVADSGWSFMRDQGIGEGARGMCSKFKTDTHIRPLLLGNTGVANAAPNTGYLLVEVFFRHYQLFDLPGFGDVIPNPIPLHAYAIFPLSAAEATPTP